MGKKFIFNSKNKKRINFAMGESRIINKEMLTGSNIQIFSDSEIIVDGCKKVIDFNNDYIKLKLSNGYLLIFGTKFVIQSFEENIIDIIGVINSVEFC